MMEQSDGDESHGAVVRARPPVCVYARALLHYLFSLWWRSSLSGVLFSVTVARAVCEAARLFPVLAGPAQPVSPHDDHWLTHGTTCLTLSRRLASAT